MVNEFVYCPRLAYLLQYADNREWLEDPAAPAIIVGTVDMIGSCSYQLGYLLEMIHTAGIHTRILQSIELLKEIGEEEEIAYNANSEQDLWRFLKRLSFIRSPKLFLLDNGNLRAVWKGDGGKHIGLQFLGGEQIQFVIFSRRGEHNNMARIRGRDDFAGITRQLDASAIGDVIYA